MKKIGYLRVSTAEQLFDRQINALRPLCDELYVETLSALAQRRPFYDRVVRRLRRGDRLIVLDTDRAYRSARDALNELHKLRERGIGFDVINFPMDTTTAEGRFALTVNLAASELERDMLARRTREGLVAARARGKVLGRPRKLSKDQLAEARELLLSPGNTLETLAPKYHVSRWTLSRNLKGGRV